MTILSNYYNGLICHCNNCGALLGYRPEDVHRNSYVTCPLCRFEILTKIQLDYDGIVREENKSGETVVQ